MFYNRSRKKVGSMFTRYFEDDVLFVVPYAVRLSLLRCLAKEPKLYQISFLSKEEFMERYFFKISYEEAIAYLHEQTKERISILREKLELLPKIDPTKSYSNEKLQDLVSLYKLLDEKGWIQKEEDFASMIQKKKVYLFGYAYLDQYEEAVFAACHAEKISMKTLHSLEEIPLYHFQTMEEEVAYVAGEIAKLHAKKIPYSKIRLAGITDEYTYLVSRIFSLYQIPIVGLLKPSLAATKEVEDYLTHLDSHLLTEDAIRKKVVQIENKLQKIPKQTKVYHLLLEDLLKNETLDVSSYVDAVSVCDFYALTEEEEMYTFVLGFNQNVLPKVFLDEEYLKDVEKKELGLDTSFEKTEKYKKATATVLKSLSHVTISYKESSSSTLYSKSYFLEEANIKERCQEEIPYAYSLSYSKIRLGEMLDAFSLYGKKHNDLNVLLQSIPNEGKYLSYSHMYTKIPSYPKEGPLYLSYSSLNDYALCKFKYYAKYILKLEEESEDTFASLLGKIYHEVLSQMYDVSFDFEECFEKATEKYSFSKKERVLLRKLKEELFLILEEIRKQDEKSCYDRRLFEQKIELSLGDNVILKGFVDKIAFLEKQGKMHYVIYDYKTGSVTLNLNYVEDGLYLQLPIYQLLVEEGNLFSNPTFTGFFYQQLLLPSKDKKTKKQNLKLKGYLLDSEEEIALFDETYSNSEVVQGLKMTQNGFSKYSKLLSRDDIATIKEKTLKQVLLLKQGILENDFTINPKRLKKENISCKYCPFQDVCFHDEKDVVFIPEKKEV